MEMTYISTTSSSGTLADVAPDGLTWIQNRSCTAFSLDESATFFGPAEHESQEDVAGTKVDIYRVVDGVLFAIRAGVPPSLT